MLRSNMMVVFTDGWQRSRRHGTPLGQMSARLFGQLVCTMCHGYVAVRRTHQPKLRGPKWARMGVIVFQGSQLSSHLRCPVHWGALEQFVCGCLVVGAKTGTTHASNCCIQQIDFAGLVPQPVGYLRVCVATATLGSSSSHGEHVQLYRRGGSPS